MEIAPELIVFALLSLIALAIFVTVIKMARRRMKQRRLDRLFDKKVPNLFIEFFDVLACALGGATVVWLMLTIWPQVAEQL